MDQDDEFQYGFIDHSNSIYGEALSFSEFMLLFAQYKRAMHENMYRLKQPKPFFFIQQKENNASSAYRKADD